MSSTAASLITAGLFGLLASACGSSGTDDGGTGTGGTNTGGTSTGGSTGGTTGGHDGGPDGGPDAGCGGIHCGPFTPVCDENKICRQCVQDSDCQHKNSTPHCFLPDSGADDPYALGHHCYQCLSGADCVASPDWPDAGHGDNTNGPICDTMNFDTIFTCGTDCRADGGPDSGSPCLIPDDAGAVLTPYCNPNSGKCAACLGDNDCSFIDPSKPWCLQSSGRCVECRGESDCNDAGTTVTPHCLVQTGGKPGADNHTCVQCRNAYDCPSSIYGLAGCQPSGNVGHKGHYCGKCNAGTDCRAAPGADAGVCLTGFPYGGWVPASCGCDPAAGNTGCGPDAPFCLQLAGPPPPVGVCVCNDGAQDYCDHSKGFVCDTQNYLGSGCVADCNLDGGCNLLSKSPVCNPDSGVCVGCVQDNDCFGPGEVCDVKSNICRSKCIGGNGCPAAQPYCGSSGQDPTYCYQCRIVIPCCGCNPLPTGCPNNSHGNPEACNQLYNLDLLECF